MAHKEDDEDEFKENAMLRVAKKFLPATDKYDGARMTTKVDGRRMVTPMLIVMVAIGTTDLLFALDSIPAIFGLTKEPYLVFTANAFALMGLRQLFFLIGGLLDKLVYLSLRARGGARLHRPEAGVRGAAPRRCVAGPRRSRSWCRSA